MDLLQLLDQRIRQTRTETAAYRTLAASLAAQIAAAAQRLDGVRAEQAALDALHNEATAREVRARERRERVLRDTNREIAALKAKIVATAAEADALDRELRQRKVVSTEDDKVVLTLRVADPSGAETYYRVKPTQPLTRVLRAHAARKGIKPTAVRLAYEDAVIDHNRSPRDLGLPDLALLLCVFRNNNARSDAKPAARILTCESSEGAAIAVQEDPNAIVVAVRTPETNDAFYSLSTLARLDQLFKAHAKRINAPTSDLAFFTREGHRHLRETQTPVEVGLADLAQVLCVCRTTTA